MVDVAAVAGCDYVKFQKRNPDICVPENQKSKMKDTPWGRMKYIDYKKQIEFGEDEYKQLFSYSEERGIKCFASVWDKDLSKFYETIL